MSLFKKPKKSILLAERLRMVFRKRTVVQVLFSLLGLGLSLFLLVYLLQKSMDFSEPPPAESASPTPVFDAEEIFLRAKALIARAEAHEYRGRRQEVLANYIEALKLLDEIKEKSPGFRQGEVESKVLFCENKIRKAK